MNNNTKFVVIKENSEETPKQEVKPKQPNTKEVSISSTDDIVTKEEPIKPDPVSFNSFNEQGEIESVTFDEDDSGSIDSVDTFAFDSDDKESVTSSMNGGETKVIHVDKPVKSPSISSEDSDVESLDRLSFEPEDSDVEEESQSSGQEDAESLDTVDILSLDPLYSVLAQLFKGKSGKTIGENIENISEELKKLNKNLEKLQKK